MQEKLSRLQEELNRLEEEMRETRVEISGRLTNLKAIFEKGFARYKAMLEEKEIKDNDC